MGGPLALDGRQSLKNTQQSTKNSSRDGGDYGGEARQAGGAGEAQYHCFGGGFSFDNKKIK
jgi:hypothetical protein